MVHLCLQVWIKLQVKYSCQYLFPAFFPAMGKSFKQVNDTERHLVKGMVKEGIPWTTIQRITGRSPDTINSIVHAKGHSPGSMSGR